VLPVGRNEGFPYLGNEIPRVHGRVLMRDWVVDPLPNWGMLLGLALSVRPCQVWQVDFPTLRSEALGEISLLGEYSLCHWA